MSCRKTKVCLGCGLDLPLSEFHRRMNRPCGYGPRCKSCVEAQKKVYRAKHHEEIAAYNKSWRAKHPGYDKAWKDRARERVRMLERARYHERKKLGTLQKKDWAAIKKRQREKDPEKHHAQLRAAARRRRDRKFAAAELFTTDMETHVYAFQGDKCQICGAVDKLCLDHWMPLCLGFPLSIQNAVVLCKPCNSHKNRNLPQDTFSSGVVSRVERMLKRQEKEWQKWQRVKKRSA